MIIYDLRQEMSGNYHRCYSEQFPSVNGFGLSTEQAYKDYHEKLDIELNRVIRANKRFPAPLSAHEIAKRQKEFDGFYKMGILSPSRALTMYLHLAMLEQNVSRGELARLLALDDDDVKDDDWQLDKLRYISPRKAPQNKKVQRLLDISHKSTISEVYEALYVMNYGLDFIVKLRWASEDEILKIQ